MDSFDRESTNPLAQEASVLFTKAYEFQMNGLLDLAIEYYVKSIDLYPTAEARTFLGWAYSYQGKVYDAIEQCKLAIQLDPDFGNPYNDIGSYLLTLDRVDEAIPWLEMAIKAKRYDPRHFPYINLAKACTMKNMYLDAVKHLEKAKEFNPLDSSIMKEMMSLLSKLN